MNANNTSCCKSSTYNNLLTLVDSNNWLLFGVCFVISFLFLSVFAYSTSIFSNQILVDQAAWTVIGRSWFNGLVPYRDIFDHKGPLLYLINGIGYLICSGRFGLMLLEALFLAADTAFTYRTARLYVGKNLAWIACAFMFFCLLAYSANGGNLTEEWSLLFNIVPIYLALKHLKSSATPEAMPKWISFAIGVCFGAQMLIVIKNGAPIGGLLLGFAALLCIRRQFTALLAHAGVVLGGVVLINLPFYIYFIAENAFSEFISGNYTFNIDYTRHFADSVGLEAQVQRAKCVLFMLLDCGLVYFLSRKKLINLGESVVVMSTAFISALSMFFGLPCTHYFIVCIPMAALQLVWLFIFVKNTNRRSLVVVATLAQVLTIAVPARLCLEVAKNNIKELRATNSLEPEYKAVAAYLSEHPDGTFWNNSGLMDYHYYVQDIPQYKYSLLAFYWYGFSDDVRQWVDELFAKKDRPKYILTRKEIEYPTAITDNLSAHYVVAFDTQNLALYCLSAEN